jgi:hypothetical protein
MNYFTLPTVIAAFFLLLSAAVLYYFRRKYFKKDIDAGQTKDSDTGKKI